MVYYPPETAVGNRHISSTRPRAKKEYVCFCCGQPITKGEKHYKNVYKTVGDDKIKWERAHIKCPGWPA
jgi:hypothetical protein